MVQHRGRRPADRQGAHLPARPWSWPRPG